MSRRVPVAGGDICAAFREERAEGPVFVKELTDAPEGFFQAEAHGLDWLRVDGGPPLPKVLEVTPTSLTLSWVEAGRPSAEAARSFGVSLAQLHATGEDSFGGGGYAATVPLDPTHYDDWPTFFAEARLLPLVALAVDAGHLTDDQARVIERACDRLGEVPEEPPARIHGDLWSGNLLWGADGQVWLVDAAAAHNGHRETDLALLHLFGAPQLTDVVAAYQEVAPLAPGWQDRLGLHQLHPLLLHAVLFGGGYGAAAAREASHYL